MALEIKILDYGDIELESSFLVLGRDCGRTRRVLTLGFLIVGGPYPIVVDTGYRSRRAHGRRPLRLPHPPAHRPRRQG